MLVDDPQPVLAGGNDEAVVNLAERPQVETANACDSSGSDRNRQAAMAYPESASRPGDGCARPVEDRKRLIRYGNCFGAVGQEFTAVPSKPRRIESRARRTDVASIVCVNSEYGSSAAGCGETGSGIADTGRLSISTSRMVSRTKS